MIYPHELLTILFGVMLPGLVIAWLLLGLLVRRYYVAQRIWIWWISCVGYTLLAMLVSVLLTVWLPPWTVRWLGFQGTQLLGIDTYWTPSVVLACAIAWLPVVWMMSLFKQK